MDAVISRWDWGTPASSPLWGWDFGLVALAMTRLRREPSEVVRMLLMDVQKNHYLPSGHVVAGFIPCYVPGNGGLLASVAMMAGGAKGGNDRAWFPPEWGARVEGFREYP